MKALARLGFVSRAPRSHAIVRSPSVAFHTPARMQSTSTDQQHASINSRADKILNYWLGEGYLSATRTHMDSEQAKKWFRGGDQIDQEVKQMFTQDLDDAFAGKLSSWDSGYEGLAAVILMDQFTRNVYRGTPRAFALDQQAITLADSLWRGGSLDKAPFTHRTWLVIPLMHSEELQNNQECKRRYEQLKAEAEKEGGDEGIMKMLGFGVDFAQQHLAIIEKYGRYPHRNEFLGRQNTPEEDEGFAQGTIGSF